jgi:hypothetical protein
MAAMQIRLNQKTVESMREFGKDRFGDSTDDKIVWTLVLDVKRLEAENELVNIKLVECREENKQKDERIKELEREIKRLKEENPQ